MTSSDSNMSHLEAPQDLLQITDRTPGPEQAVEIANPAVCISKKNGKLKYIAFFTGET